MHAPLPAAASALTKIEIQTFEQDGFLLKRGLASAGQVARIAREIEALHEEMARAIPEGVGVTWDQKRAGRPRRIRQLMHSERVSPGLNAFLRSEAVLDVVEALIGPRIALFHSKLLMKAAHDGTLVPWHQDFGYWKRKGGKPVQLNAMLAIDPQTKENGCIQFVPGSQKRGLIEHVHKETGYGFGTYLPGYFNARPDALAVEMRPGDCVFFGPLVIHGSDGNQSAQDRRANTFAFTLNGDVPEYCREFLRG